MSFRRTIQDQWLKFRQLQGDPRKLASGMALGVFIAFTPTVPFQTTLALFLATILGVSPVTAMMGILICNPLTIPPMYLAAYTVGNFLLRQGAPLSLPETYNFADLTRLIWQGGLALQVGGIIIAIPPAITAYFLTLWIIRRYSRRKAAGAAATPQNPHGLSGPED